MPDLVSETRTTLYERLDRLFIAGRWRTGRSDHPNRDVNPWTGETLAEIAQATREDLDDACDTVQHVPRRYPADLRKLQGPWAGG